VVIEKGQIYWYALDPIQGHEQGATRPVVVVSPNAYNKTQGLSAAVVPLTKARPRLRCASVLPRLTPVFEWPPPY
jgi:mRNA-degrading endonuclease toxin of MazEF toxin-antitoxin module